MSQNNGFTLIEEIFVLSVIIAMTLLTLPLFHHQTVQRPENIQFHISAIIDGAKAYALTLHQKVELEIGETYIAYKKDGKDVRYNLPDGASFSHIIPVSFNENGNINQANHILLNYQNSKYQLIFHLGSGDYYFKK